MKKKIRRAVPEHPYFRAKRELANQQQRVDWLLGFANQSSVEKLSSDEIHQTYTYLRAFSAKDADSSGTTIELPYSAAFLYEIQQTLRSGLRIAIKLDDRVGGHAGWPVTLDNIERRVFRGHSSYRGPLRAIFLAAVADAIAEDREKRFEMCARPTCERFFWKRASMKYCSNPCADADRQKRWRNNQQK